MNHNPDHFTADVAQLQLDGGAIDLALGLFGKRCGVFRPRALRIALRDQSITADLAHRRGKSAGLFDDQQLKSRP